MESRRTLTNCKKKLEKENRWAQKCRNSQQSWRQRGGQQHSN